MKENFHIINKYILEYLKLRKFNINTFGFSFLNFSDYHSYNRLEYCKIFSDNLQKKTEIIRNESKKISKYKKKSYNKQYNEIDTVILSYITSPDQINNNDFYFNNLIKKKKLQEDKILFIYNNLTKIDNYELEKKNKTKKIFFLSTRISFFKELKNFILINYEFLQGLKLYYLSKKNLSFQKFISQLFTIRNLTETLSHFRISNQINELLKKYKPKNFLLLIEGKLFENFLISNVRKVNKNIIIYGYQHSIITQNHFGFRRKFEKKFEPDVLFTTGNYNREILSKYGTKSEIIGPKTNYMEKIEVNEIFNLKNNNKKIIKILILSEGLKEEYNFFFNLCNQLSKLEGIELLWRNHPALKIEEIHKDFYKLNNFNISESNSLGDDAIKADIAIYRGSSAIVDALKFGVVPFYIQKDDTDGDPLFFSNIGKKLNTEQCLNYFKNFENKELFKKHQKTYIAEASELYKNYY